MDQSRPKSKDDRSIRLKRHSKHVSLPIEQEYPEAENGELLPPSSVLIRCYVQWSFDSRLLSAVRLQWLGSLELS